MASKQSRQCYSAIHRQPCIFIGEYKASSDWPKRKGWCLMSWLPIGGSIVFIDKNIKLPLPVLLWNTALHTVCCWCYYSMVQSSQWLDILVMEMVHWDQLVPSKLFKATGNLDLGWLVACYNQRDLFKTFCVFFFFLMWQLLCKFQSCSSPWEDL